jgi:ParB family transcriptional regulator, chromosome partitioning protein
MSASVQTPQTIRGTLEYLDPASLVIDYNPRKDPQLDPEFLASIAGNGVIEPVIAHRRDGGVFVLIGSRRCAAANQAKLPEIPVMVYDVDAKAADLARMVAQHAENYHRTGLTVLEEAGLIQEMLDLDLDEEMVAGALHVQESHVRTAAQVAGNDLARQAASHPAQLPLEAAAAVAEYDDPEMAAQIFAEIVGAADEGILDHKLAQLAAERETDRAVKAKMQVLTDAGYTVITELPYYTTAVHALYEKDGGKGVDPERHKACPGAVVYVGAGYDGQVVESWFCSDPPKYGHRNHDAGTGRTKPDPGSEESEAAKAERRKVIQGNKDWRAAEGVRRKWLADFAGRKTPPAGAVAFICAQLQHGLQVNDSMGRFAPLAVSLLGLPGHESIRTTKDKRPDQSYADLLAKASGPRQQVITITLILALHEAGTSVQTWRSPRFADVRYWTALKGWGYGLSEIEKGILKAKPVW